MVRLLLVLFSLPVVATAVDVTTCGQAVGPAEVGELRVDLRCHPFRNAVHLTNGSTLKLNGFTIAGEVPRAGTGVTCGGTRRGAPCTILGPGEIREFEIGIAGAGGNLRAQDVLLRANRWGMTYKAPRLIELVNVVASENDYGLTARGGRVRGTDVVASHNAIAGVWTNSITEFTRLTATSNGEDGGIFTAPFRSTHVTRLVDSDVSGNDGLGLGYDILSTGRVRLVRTTCGSAARVNVERDRSKHVKRELRCDP